MIPDGIGKLQKLEVRVLGKNQVDYQLPEAIGKCKNLMVLDAAFTGNALDLPECLGELEKLEQLFIDANTRIPPSINRMKFRLQIILKNTP